MRRLNIVFVLLLALFLPLVTSAELIVYNNARVMPIAQVANDFIKVNTKIVVNRILNDGATYVTNKANIKGLWIFDQTGAVSTITDRSGNSHDITLRDNSLNAINASTCSPGVAGLAPYLTFDSTHLWNTPDHSDFTFIEPQAFTLIVLANMTDITATTFFGKYGEITGATQKEYVFFGDGSDKLKVQIFDDSANAKLERSYNTALTGDQGSWHTYDASYSGVVSVTNIQIGRDGVQVDDTSVTSGSYTAMEDKTALPAGYIVTTDASRVYPTKGKISVIAVIAEQITAAQRTNWDRLLRSYAGVSL